MTRDLEINNSENHKFLYIHVHRKKVEPQSKQNENAL